MATIDKDGVLGGSVSPGIQDDADAVAITINVDETVDFTSSIAAPDATITTINGTTSTINTMNGTTATITTINGTTINGTTVNLTNALVVADGGTGAITAAAARTNLDAQEDLITTRGDIVRGSSIGAAERVALGTNGQVITSDGTDAAWSALPTATDTVAGVLETATQAEMEAATATDKAVTPENLTDAMTLETPIVTTSGTAHDFTGIRASAKRITVMFADVSLDGTAQLLVQLGDSGGIEDAGYVATSGAVADASSDVVDATTGFNLATTTAGNVVVASMVLTLIDPSTNHWVGFHAGLRGGNVSFHGAGDKALSGTLTQIRITSDAGDDFDGGTVNILVE